jgi:hypothetical protein
MYVVGGNLRTNPVESRFSYDGASLECFYRSEAESLFANMFDDLRCSVGSPVSAVDRLHPIACAAA